MNKYELLAQAIGIVAMVFNVISFQSKNQKGIVTLQMFGTALFTINFFMLGAIAGSITNLVGVLRCTVYLNRKKFRSDKIIWVVIFSLAFIASYILSFTVFQKDFTLKNAVTEFLPVISMILSTVAFYIGDAKTTRKFGLITQPLWLIYNIVNFAVGAIICEVLNIGSIIIGMLRYDIKRK